MSCASCARFNRYMDCFRPLKDSPKFKWELNRNLIHVGSRKTRRTDMAKAATSKPKPFLATVTPVEISKGDTVSGVRFTKMAGATVARKGVKAMTRTVMAFGRANAAVARSLKAGKPIDVLCRWDGGTVRIVGRPEKKAA